MFYYILYIIALIDDIENMKFIKCCFSYSSGLGLNSINKNTKRAEGCK